MSGTRTHMRHLLLVDDEADIREIAQLSLELGAGWHVTTAASAGDALVRLRERRPDAVLLDVMMPEVDGPTLVRALRADAATRDLPIVLLTAKVQAHERERFAGLGVAGVLTKPFDPLTLHEQVAAALGWSA